jgi:hypothetical protein
VLSVCLCIPPYHLLNAWTNLYETWYAYHGTLAHLNGVLPKSIPTICVSVCVILLSLLDNGSVNTFPLQRIHSTAGQVLDMWACIPLSLLGNNSVKTLPRQRKIVGGVVFYAVYIVSKQSRRLVLPRTSCSLTLLFLYSTIFMAIQHQISRWLVNSKFEKMWKDPS